MAVTKRPSNNPLDGSTAPIPSKSEALMRRFSRKTVVFMKRNKSNSRPNHQTDTQSNSQASFPVPAPHNQPPSSTTLNGLIHEYEQLSSPIFPEPPHSNSSQTSHSSSAYTTEATITIHPSRSLQAMQSIGLDTSPSPTNTSWHHSNRYFSPSQTSLAPDVHIPSGCPPWLAESLRTRTPAPLRLVVTNLPPSDDDATIYGPSPQDMDDLLERQRTWDVEEARKVRNPIQRMLSFGKEITGGLKRRLSMKRGFEARLERREGVSRTKSEGCGGRARGGVRRSHTVAGTEGR